MSIQIRQAGTEEYEQIRQFYYDVIDDMEGMDFHPKWQKGVYPADEYIMEELKLGEMYIAQNESQEILGAMMVNHRTNEGYDQVQWPTKARPEEITLIHALGVAVRAARTGVASAMVAYVQKLAADSGQKAVRLDVLSGNFPAEGLYRKMGFQHVTTIKLFYEDTGWHDFEMYEYPIA